MLFQSPRSGKFVSDASFLEARGAYDAGCFNPLDRGNLYLIEKGCHVKAEGWEFQSPRSGKFLSNDIEGMESKALQYMRFQSPRSGKFVSDTYAIAIIALATVIIGFNPLDWGNLYQISITAEEIFSKEGFNPLDRGNLYLIRG